VGRRQGGRGRRSKEVAPEGHRAIAGEGLVDAVAVESTGVDHRSSVSVGVTAEPALTGSQVLKLAV
jgi:hypothetical protein